MVTFFPSESNVRVLKSVLMSEFGMRSAHASEAIASFLGFGSHAAFKSRTKLTQSATVYEVDFEKFTERCVALGYDFDSSEYLPLAMTGIEWPEPVWRLFKKRDQEGRNSWFYECDRRDVPFIVISKARKYCTVEWDHISMDSHYDSLARGAFGGELGRVLLRNYQLIANGMEPKSYFNGGALVGEVTGLTEPGARQIANMLAFYLYPGNLSGRLEQAA
ncbi:MAG: hypothetical protein AAGL68_03705 [Pseudomonadota bacterium]